MITALPPCRDCVRLRLVHALELGLVDLRSLALMTGLRIERLEGYLERRTGRGSGMSVPDLMAIVRILDREEQRAEMEELP